ncbi:hypothetical protein FQZ97_834450 [compost metagenome]
MRHVARIAVALGHRQRLHQVPAREVRRAHITQLARAHEVVERGQRFFDRRARIEAVQLEQVDVVGAQPLQRRIDRLHEVMARRAHVVRPLAAAEGGLGRDQQPVTRPALDRLAQHRFGGAARVDVGAVEHVHAGVHADVDQRARLGHVGAAPRAEKLALAAEGAGAEAQHGDLEA